MCQSHVSGACLGCHHGMSRRRFVAGCGAALTSIGALGPRSVRGDDDPKKPVRVALVFGETLVKHRTMRVMQGEYRRINGEALPDQLDETQPLLD